MDIEHKITVAVDRQSGTWMDAFVDLLVEQLFDLFEFLSVHLDGIWVSKRGHDVFSWRSRLRNGLELFNDVAWFYLSALYDFKIDTSQLEYFSRG